MRRLRSCAVRWLWLRKPHWVGLAYLLSLMSALPVALLGNVDTATLVQIIATVLAAGWMLLRLSLLGV